MRNFFVGAAVAVAIVMLVGAGANSNTGLPALKDLPLASAFRQDVVVAYNKPWTITMPATTGFVVTHTDFDIFQSSFKWAVRMNGTVWNSPAGKWQEGPLPLAGVNPPRIIPPGATLTISWTTQINPAPSAVSGKLAGYFISRADLGL